MQRHAVRSPHLLLIDDDSRFLSTTADLLRRDGYGVVTAADSVCARREACRIRFDLFLCSTHISEESGAQLCAELRQLPGQEDAALMFTSTTQYADVIRRVYDAGGAYFVRKPLHPEILLTLIERAIGPALIPPVSFAAEPSSWNSGLAVAY